MNVMYSISGSKERKWSSKSKKMPQFTFDSDVFVIFSPLTTFSFSIIQASCCDGDLTSTCEAWVIII